MSCWSDMIFLKPGNLLKMPFFAFTEKIAKSAIVELSNILNHNSTEIGHK